MISDAFLHPDNQTPARFSVEAGVTSSTWNLINYAIKVVPLLGVYATSATMEKLTEILSLG